MNYIAVLENTVEAVEQLSLYWDATGLDMHLAVKMGTPRDGSVIAIASKHWARVHYLEHTGLSALDAWEAIVNVARAISRTLVLSVRGPYVYIPKLNAAQTQNVMNHLKREVARLADGQQPVVRRLWQLEWDIEDAVVAPEIIPPYSEDALKTP